MLLNKRIYGFKIRANTRFGILLNILKYYILLFGVFYIITTLNMYDTIENDPILKKCDTYLKEIKSKKIYSEFYKGYKIEDLRKGYQAGTELTFFSNFFLWTLYLFFQYKLFKKSKKVYREAKYQLKEAKYQEKIRIEEKEDLKRQRQQREIYEQKLKEKQRIEQRKKEEKEYKKQRILDELDNF